MILVKFEQFGQICRIALKLVRKSQSDLARRATSQHNWVRPIADAVGGLPLAGVGAAAGREIARHIREIGLA